MTKTVGNHDFQLGILLDGDQSGDWLPVVSRCDRLTVPDLRNVFVQTVTWFSNTALQD
nr:hypothetical protein [Cutibacterium avidum]